MDEIGQLNRESIEEKAFNVKSLHRIFGKPFMCVCEKDTGYSNQRLFLSKMFLMFCKIKLFFRNYI